MNVTDKARMNRGMTGPCRVDEPLEFWKECAPAIMVSIEGNHHRQIAPVVMQAEVGPLFGQIPHDEVLGFQVLPAFPV